MLAGAIDGDAAECIRRACRHTLDVDLNGLGCIERCRIVTINGVLADILFSKLFFQSFDGGIRLGFEGILYLDLENNMASAF